MTDTDLAAQFLQSLHALKKTRPLKTISESMQGELFVLKFLRSHGDFVLPGEISSAMCISSARTAAALKSLEQKGMIARRVDTQDRRKVLVSITQSGKDLIEQHHRVLTENTAKMLHLLGEDDALAYIRITRRLAEICRTELTWHTPPPWAPQPKAPHTRKSGESTEEPPC